MASIYTSPVSITRRFKPSIILILIFLCNKAIYAQTTYGTTTVGANGGGSQMAPCTEILRLNGYNDGTAGSVNGQNFVFRLGNGDSLFFNIKRTQLAMSTTTAPTTAATAFGAYGYTGLAGQTVLYQTHNAPLDSTHLQFSNILLKDRYGNQRTDFKLVIFDGENTGYWESITLTAPISNTWNFYDSVSQTTPGYTRTIISGLNTSLLKLTGPQPYNFSAYMDIGVSINDPTSFMVDLDNNGTSPGLEGIVIGIDRRISGVNDTICGSGNITLLTLNAAAGTTYTWGNPVINPVGSITGATSQSIGTTTISQTLTNTIQSPAMAIYTITPSSCGVAGNTFNDTVLLKPSVSVQLGNDTSLCTGQSLVLHAGNAGATYRWQDNSSNATYTVTAAGNYAVTVTNNSGCTGSDNINITYLTGPPTINLGNDTTYCGGFTRTLSSGYSGTTWSTGVTAAQITINSPGTYWARITTACGTITDTIVINQSQSPVVNLGNDTSLCTGQSLVLNAGNAGATYRWQNNSSNATYSVTVSGNYSVTVTNSSGCSASDNINVSYVSVPPAV
ncbi:MAG TPA: PKD-like domain-containing protein, partial [Chitinophagales bacterium]|nr:PKD-like domain-containing protein [Chitinophagales bacterium]